VIFAPRLMTAASMIMAVLIGAAAILLLLGAGFGTLLFVLVYLTLPLATGMLLWREFAAGSLTSRDVVAVAVLWIRLGAFGCRLRCRNRKT
jgi:hypothetical protein